MTSLADIRVMVRNSNPADWELLEAGPWYLDGFGMVSDRDGGYRLETRWHPSLAVWRPDVSLRLMWGMRCQADDRDDDGLRFDWHFPNPKMTLEFVDVLWCGDLVDRLVVVSVDGGRCLLPCPNRPLVVDSGQHHPEIVAETVPAYKVDVARLVDVIGRGRISEFDRYFDQAGIVELPDE